MFERRLYHHIDWALVAAIVALCAMGLFMVYSASGGSRLVVTQTYALGLGFVGFAIALAIDYRTLADKSHFIYLALLGVLIYVLLFGDVQMNARRWISLGAFNLQPSEFAKIGVALVLAKFLGENRGLLNS